MSAAITLRKLHRIINEVKKYRYNRFSLHASELSGKSKLNITDSRKWNFSVSPLLVIV